MGFDRLSNFIIKNLNYNHGFIIDEVKRKILSNHVFFDLNFIIYNQMFELEDEINDIIKIILNLPFSYTDDNKTDDKLQEILELPWWKTFCENIEYLFDGNKENEIIEKFINFITTKNSENLNKIDYMIISKVIFNIDKFIETYHNSQSLDSIGFFIDGIPSFSKILEQRRRRVKNYYESNARKQKFETYFGNVNNLYMNEDGIKYNYFKWITNRFSFDKSFSSVSPFIRKLEKDLLEQFIKKYKGVDIILDSALNNGESDIKIFQHIQKAKLTGDIIIHTTDSDLIHSIMVQQVYYLINRTDINISVIRHNKETEFVQVYNATVMINCLLKMYSNVVNKEITDYRIIYDFGLILLFFGNDHLPSSFEIGPEIGIDLMFKLYSKINNTGQTIINLVNDEITIDFARFKDLLKLYQLNNFTKIFLTRNFKLTPNITHILTDKNKMNLTFNEILELFKLILISDGLKIKDLLDKDDIRFKLINKFPEISELDLINFLTKYNDFVKDEFNNIKENILDNIDFQLDDFCGIQNYIKPFSRSDDNYQDLYNILTENTMNEINSKNTLLSEPSKDDYLNFIKQEYNNETVDSYLKKLYHLVSSQFGSLKKFHTNNITAYSFNTVPKLEHLIKYIEEKINVNKWIEEIKADNIEDDDYFNCINHHIYITPYLKLEDIKDNSIKSTVKTLNVDNLWIDNKNIEDFSYNQVKPNEFLKEWETATRESEFMSPEILHPTTLF
jgi:hypothetical protein